MPDIQIQGIQNRLPIIRLDGKDYFIMGGTYQRLPNEKIITEQYTAGGSIDRQIQQTYCWRWQFTLVVPATYDLVSLSAGVNFDVGDMTYFHASADKLPPDDLLEYYDISCFEDFSGTYTHLVYLRADWEQPFRNDDPGVWQVPVQLWGYEP